MVEIPCALLTMETDRDKSRTAVDSLIEIDTVGASAIIKGEIK